jgi:hypothetical protein
MRLFLSSYRAGNYPDKLADLFGKTKVAVISNAKDYKSPGERKNSWINTRVFGWQAAMLFCSGGL